MVNFITCLSDFYRFVFPQDKFLVVLRASFVEIRSIYSISSAKPATSYFISMIKTLLKEEQSTTEVTPDGLAVSSTVYVGVSSCQC